MAIASTSEAIGLMPVMRLFSYLPSIGITCWWYPLGLPQGAVLRHQQHIIYVENFELSKLSLFQSTGRVSWVDGIPALLAAVLRSALVSGASVC